MTVAIPVRDGARVLPEVLAAVRRQELDRPVELLVVDSGSRDRSVEIARAAGAHVIEIQPFEFSHGGTRNLMMEVARGDHVAFLTQDATPIGRSWLAKLLEGFEHAPDVALTFGPYVPRPDASHTIQREFRDFFGSFAPNGRPQLQRLDRSREALAGYRRRPSPLTFFTDANGCVARWAWERVRYRDIGYAEDQLLAAEMIEAGFAKVYQPEAGVLHSHRYRPSQLFRRCFDEWRGLREVYGHVESAAPKRFLKRVLEETRSDAAFLRECGVPPPGLLLGSLRSVLHHSVRMAGAVAGSRADRLPPSWRARLSLEGRTGFFPAAGPSQEALLALSDERVQA